MKAQEVAPPGGDEEPMPITENAAVLLASIDAQMLWLLEKEGEFRRKRQALRLARTQLLITGRATAVLALLVEPAPELGPPR